MDPSSGIGTAATSLAASLGAASSSPAETAKGVKVLKAALTSQSALLDMVMKSLGVGQNVDLQG
ncbi:MAG: hypothetical protein HYY93_04075 [Planctomycetes bacterium]|nr:hypothetical protein [Planctomycetota bacterium]